MRLSLYTPTHDPRWLGECYKSLRWQTYQDFEWVLVLNGIGTGSVPADLAADPRVRLLQADDALGNVGRLKHRAVAACTGDLLVELDHDDLLTPNALEALRAAALQTPDAFYFSDCAGFRLDGTPDLYRTDHGWETYPYELWQHTFTAHRTFPVTARSLCEIYYAPDHVRAWSRAAYLKAGPYNPDLPVADDHDLLCRTYLAGVEFVHLPQCLYLARRTPSAQGGSTTNVRNAEIQQRQTQNCHQYLHGLAVEWGRRNNLRRADLATAREPAAGFEAYGLSDMAAWPDGSVGVLRAVNVLERLPRSHFAAFMNELYRVLAPGGWLLSMTPSTDGRGAFQDPANTNFVNANSTWYFTDRNYAKYVPEVQCRFQSVRTVTAYPSAWHQEHQISYLYWDACALKGQRHPGLQRI